MLQAWFAPHSRRYHCDVCGVKFNVAPASGAKEPEPTANYELPPLRVDSLTDATGASTQKSRTPNGRHQTDTTARRTTHLHVTDEPDIPGISNSAEKAALKRMAEKNKALQQELKRLRQIEKKYRQLKKANHFLAKASTQRR